MKAKKLTANQVKNLINEVKEIYRLCGFETGKRTNLQKALKECRFDYAELGKGIDTSLCYPENVFNKEYQNEKKHILIKTESDMKFGLRILNAIYSKCMKQNI